MAVVFEDLKQPRNIHKNNLCQIVIYLACNDIVAARNAFGVHMNEDAYLPTDECAASEDLVRAYESFDDEKLTAVKANRTFHYVEGGIAKLVRNLRVGNTAVGYDEKLAREIFVESPVKNANIATPNEYTSSGIHLLPSIISFISLLKYLLPQLFNIFIFLYVYMSTFSL